MAVGYKTRQGAWSPVTFAKQTRQYFERVQLTGDRMNRNRIIISGFVAGGFILAMNLLQIEYVATNVAGSFSDPNPLSFHIVRSLALGLASMLLYAILAKSRGHELETAVTTGLLVFIIGVLFPAFALGTNLGIPDNALLIYIAWSALWLPAATTAGAQFYRESVEVKHSTV
jgi:hypothetical protein